MSEHGYIGEFFIWLLGRPLVKPSKPATLVFWSPPQYWEVTPFPGVTWYMQYAPDVFRRAMMQVFFGIVFRRKSND